MAEKLNPRIQKIAVPSFFRSIVSLLEQVYHLNLHISVICKDKIVSVLN
jgi:hypothetical protein